MPATKMMSGALVAAVLVAASATSVLAQSNFPNRPIRLLVPFAPGGGVDVVTRVVGQKFSERIGQSILVEVQARRRRRHRGQRVAALRTGRPHAPGHDQLARHHAGAEQAAWHPSNDFTPVANFYSTMFLMPTNSANASKFRTFKEFLTYTRANPGKINWGSSGIGGPQHLAGAHFAKVANLDMVHVPYRGNGPMLQALLAGDVQLTFDTPTWCPHIQDGKVLALAVTGDRRMAKLPEVPTVRENGIDSPPMSGCS